MFKINKVMKVSTIINSAIQSLELKKYLELGVSNGATFLEIKAPVRVGVDPAENSCATVKEDLESYLTHSKESFDVIYLNLSLIHI